MRSIRLDVQTRGHCELVDITARVRSSGREAGLREGGVLVYSQHTTAGITIQEGADPDVRRDLLRALENAVPETPPDGHWDHAEGNAPAHVKTALVGVSQLIPVAGGELQLGTWQAVYLCEFDGPRARQVVVQSLFDVSG